ncbi:unnamed protein product [Cylindrotheca closterium]|uniref:Uncharacterized protein n=1 Tax=Cylindrotheca closterium TaxID=2856 RepID=A0AAD2CQM6_9STRA|nr:unnamed protein product [Cylindrotheca closterium]
MIINTQPKINGYNALSHQTSSEKAFPFEMKVDTPRLDEGESDSLCKFNVLPKRKLCIRLQSTKPLGGKLHVSFEKILTHASDASEPAPKRRRFQRRNSKTANMLSMSMLPVLALDLEDKAKTTSSCPEYDDDINIAEDLVRHFQANRKRAQQLEFSLAKS